MVSDMDYEEKVKLVVMPENLRMNAYYYSFEKTGVREIDEILSAVAMAGKGYHNTDDWQDDGDRGYSYIELIQEVANRAAAKFQLTKKGE